MHPIASSNISWPGLPQAFDVYLHSFQDRGEGFVVAERVVFRDHEHLDREVFRDEAAPEALDAGSPNRRVVVGRVEAASTCGNPA